MRNSALDKTAVRGEALAGSGKALSGLLRYVAWLAAVVILVIGVMLSWSGVKRVFLLRNPHFLLKNIDVAVQGQMRTAEILERLRAMKVRAGESNLFELDLARIRKDLCKYVLISNANLWVQLPGTLHVEIRERIPVAKFMGQGGRLVDAEGWLLPARFDSKPEALPILIGARGNRSLATGSKVNDDMVTSALHLLHLLAIRPYGRYLDTAAIQLDYDRDALRIHLRARGTFRDGAQVLLPAKPLDMEEALQRVEIIAKDRSRGNQVTGFVDGTYRINVPVMP